MKVIAEMKKNGVYNRCILLITKVYCEDYPEFPPPPSALPTFQHFIDSRGSKTVPRLSWKAF